MKQNKLTLCNPVVKSITFTPVKAPFGTRIESEILLLRKYRNRELKMSIHAQIEKGPQKKNGSSTNLNKRQYENLKFDKINTIKRAREY